MRDGDFLSDDNDGHNDDNKDDDDDGEDIIFVYHCYYPHTSGG